MIVIRVGLEPTRIAPLADDDNDVVASLLTPEASAITTRPSDRVVQLIIDGSRRGNDNYNDSV